MVRGQKIVMFCIHIWIPNEILSILSTHTWRKTANLPPHRMPCRSNQPLSPVHLGQRASVTRSAHPNPQRLPKTTTTFEWEGG